MLLNDAYLRACSAEDDRRFVGKRTESRKGPYPWIGRGICFLSMSKF